MAAIPPDPYDDILASLRITLRSPVNFQDTDSNARQAQARYLTNLALYVNIVAVENYGGRSGSERSSGLTEQVVAAAFQTYGGVDPYTDPFVRAALLLRGITQGHPFNDGNKRTGFVVALYYLRAVGYPPPDVFSTDAVVEFCLAVSAGTIRDVSVIAEGLRKLWFA